MAYMNDRTHDEHDELMDEETETYTDDWMNRLDLGMEEPSLENEEIEEGGYVDWEQADDEEDEMTGLPVDAEESEEEGHPLFDSENYRVACMVAKSRKGGIIGGGYLPPKHQEAVIKEYGSLYMLLKFRIEGDTISYKPEHRPRTSYKVKTKIEGPDDLKGIANSPAAYGYLDIF